jgi:hypothetical protein
MANQKRYNSALIAFLALMASGEWMPRKALGLMGYHPGYVPRLLSQMQDAGYISCSGGHKDGRCHIKRAGYALLAESNPLRFSELMDDDDEKRIRWEDGEIYRQTCRSMLAVMSRQAGYGIHPHDKPDLCTVGQDRLPPADRPALIAQAASGIDIPHADGEAPPLNSMNNYTDYRYYDESDDVQGSKRLDTGIYRIRKTPVGCVYTRADILTLARRDMNPQEKTGGNIQNINGSSISGLLFSANGAYKIYVTGHIAPKFKPSFDRIMTQTMEVWAGNAYLRSLDNLQRSIQKKYLRGSILIGDGSYRAAMHVIRATQDKYLMIKGKRRRVSFGIKDRIDKGDLYNLEDMPGTYYIPAIREALPVFSAFIYPLFEMKLRDALFPLTALAGITGYSPVEHPEFYDAQADDGRYIACMVPLNLDRMLAILRDIKSDTLGVVIYCPEYEQKFYNLLLQALGDEKAGLFEIVPIPQDYFEEFYIGVLQKEFGYDGPFPVNPNNRWARTASEQGVSPTSATAKVE